MSKYDWKNKKELEKIVRNAKNSTDALRKMKLRCAGGNYNTFFKYIKKYNLCTKHFTKRHDEIVRINKEGMIPLTSILNGEQPQYNAGALKKRILAAGLKENVCEECGQTSTWNNKNLVLQLDHINGNSGDHRLQNLKIVCPNCHTQTPTFAGRNSSLKGCGKYSPKYGSKIKYHEAIKKQYESTQYHYIDIVENSDIDFSKLGWVGKVAPIINQKPQHVGKWMASIMPSFYKNCYKRKVPE